MVTPEVDKDMSDAGLFKRLSTSRQQVENRREQPGRFPHIKKDRTGCGRSHLVDSGGWMGVDGVKDWKRSIPLFLLI